MNIIAWLEYELTDYDSAVHRFNHYTTKTPPITKKDNFCSSLIDYLPIIPKIYRLIKTHNLWITLQPIISGIGSVPPPHNITKSLAEMLTPSFKCSYQFTHQEIGWSTQQNINIENKSLTNLNIKSYNTIGIFNVWQSLKLPPAFSYNALGNLKENLTQNILVRQSKVHLDKNDIFYSHILHIITKHNNCPKP